MRVKFLLIIIILIASILRIYKLEQIPPSLNWDELAAGYNAYTIANWGADEWGKPFPLIFTSFKDDKHPVHIYITSFFVKLFGLSDFSIRLSGAILGILNVLIIFYLAQLIFNSKLVGLLSALFLAVSPYHLQFSRGLWEANFAPFFFMLGLLLFFKALQKRGWLLNISFFCFGLSIISYHSSKIIIPPILLMLILLYFKDLKKILPNFYTSMLVLLIFVGLFFIEPRLLGTARAKQTQFAQLDIEKTQLYQKTKNSLLGFGEIVLNQYLSHFSLSYLFISGDQSPRNSIKVHGEFYKVDALFIVIGLLALIKLKSRISLIILAWLVLSPVPASLVKGAPSATRAIFMLGGLQLISAFGAYSIVKLFKGYFRKIILILLLVILAGQTLFFLNYYINTYPKKDGHEWQYGMKQIVEYVREHEEYGQIYVTDVRAQPYIFFLAYLNFPLPQFLNSVLYNNDEKSNKYNSISYFGGYYSLGKDEIRRINVYFGGWDILESAPEKGILYVLTPYQYDGLKHRSSLEIKKSIKNPDGGDTFYLVGVI